MTDRQYVSTAQVAAALGVGTTTVKRWVDEGVLPAQRTAGKHRRILVADVLRVARSRDFPRLDLNPNTGEPIGRHTHQIVAEQAVHGGTVTLPVIP